MNTNVYENTDSETITPLNKRRILPVFLLVGLYAASTAYSGCNVGTPVQRL
ncbi:multidrug efflux protein [Salmonella enterica subsp. enterica serovar Senftenberg str. A4-543]|uniref:Multidrug efflux protein n=1 Tax=Salmonella enterica subsp. enterica serovar Senftenberg str. A4-543 TaxID=913082 RepID=G5R064_SALSE|nr:multidrug efflux protein [Salmonella enterica subsp. enterica serovar Senftenberg str. A4-543]